MFSFYITSDWRARGAVCAASLRAYSDLDSFTNHCTDDKIISVNKARNKSVVCACSLPRARYQYLKWGCLKGNKDLKATKEKDKKKGKVFQADSDGKFSFSWADVVAPGYIHEGMTSEARCHGDQQRGGWVASAGETTSWSCESHPF